MRSKELYELAQIERELMDLSLRLNGMSREIERRSLDYPEIARALWKKLGEVPVYKNLRSQQRIDQEFLHFPVDTPIEDIWDWFEQAFNLSVAEDLMGIK